MVHSSESGGGFCTWWDMIGDMEVGVEGGWLVGPSMCPFLSYLAFV